MRVFYTELASYCVLLTVRIISSLCGSNCQIHSCFLSLSGRNGSFSSPYLSNHTYLRWHQVNIKRGSWIQTSLTISKLKHFFDTTAVTLIWFEPYSVIATGGVQRWAPTGHLSPEQCFGGGDLADPIWAAFNQPNSAGDVERQGALCCAVPCRSAECASANPLSEACFKGHVLTAWLYPAALTVERPQPRHAVWKSISEQQWFIPELDAPAHSFNFELGMDDATSVFCNLLLFFLVRLEWVLWLVISDKL